MAQNASELQYATDGDILIAPFGTTLPETISDTPDAAFVNVGYATTDGVNETTGQEVSETEAWQSATPINRKVIKRLKGLAATLLQTNRANYRIAFGGGTWEETAPGEYKYTPPADSEDMPEYSVIVEIRDGDIHDRIILKRATMGEEIEVQHVRNEAAQYPLKFDALTPDGEDTAWEFQSDNPAFGEGS
jgi:hypothetical protein